MKSTGVVAVALAAVALPLAAGAAPKETVLYDFQRSTDGGLPLGGVIMDGKGNLYGTASIGGTASNVGSAFELVRPKAKQPWVLMPLHDFTGGADGATPEAPLMMDAAGALFGTTTAGGSANAGTVFELTVKKGVWSEQVLYGFAGGEDGYAPHSGLIMDSSGNLYGTTEWGGGSGTGCELNNVVLYCGTVFELSPPAKKKGKWAEKVLYSFQGGNDGARPMAGLVMDAGGALYGTTQYGNPFGFGTVFKLTPSGSGGSTTWTESLVHSFTDGGGAGPVSPLIFDGAGNLFGATNEAVFEIGGPGGSGEFTVPFQLGDGDGYNPGGLLLDGSGDLYALNMNAGTYNAGNIFELSPPASGTVWNFSTLYSFGGVANDGGNPTGNLVMNSKGTMFGETNSGGTHNLGTIFSFVP